MKINKPLKIVLFFLLIPALLLTGCKEANKKTSADGKVQTYTCPMHPQIVQDKPGTCPICGMDLVPFDKNNKEASLTLSESQTMLANITTTTVGTSQVTDFKQLNGRLAIDPEKTAIVSSRMPGRIETLYIKETGIKVSKGQPLYKIYSEQLAALQQEYLLTITQAAAFPQDQRFQQLRDAARQKLILYGQSEAQLSGLVRANKVNPYVIYPSTVSGVVSEIMVGEGQYVTEGGAVMRVEGYDQLWVEADVYPAEVSSLHTGQPVGVIISGWENEPQKMTIQFMNPTLQDSRQLVQVRGSIDNPGNRWQPGQQASILISVKSRKDAISLPVDAVIRDGRGAHVWIETGKGKFEPRIVSTGIESADAVEISSGLKEGDKVVISGAYLLYSEYILKKGSDPTAGMKGM